MDDLLKSADVAELLRVHPKQVYRLLKRGLPGRRVGGEWRFVRAEVLRWADTTEKAPADAAAVDVQAGPPPLLAANGDLLIEVLLAQLARARQLVGFVQADAATALRHLREHAVLLAGYHAETPPSHIEAARLARIHLARREVGLAFPETQRVRKLGDIGGKRLALRPSTAGVRAHFDRALRGIGSLKSLGATAVDFDSHREAVCAVLCDDADVALTTSGWAARVGLRFLPLANESYDLLLYAEHLGRPPVVSLCEVVQERAFRAALARLPGYDPAGAGQIRYSFDE